MATFPTPSQMSATYFQYLKSLKPDLDITDPNSDFVIRGNVLMGVLSGIWGDQQKVNADTFIADARNDALIKKGADYGLALQPATVSVSTQVRFTGTAGSPVPTTLQLLYPSTGIYYQPQASGTIGSSGYVDLTVQCTQAGQVGNITAPDSLTLLSPPTGVDAQAQILSSFADGTDIESYDSFRARLSTRLQSAPAGGNANDYQQFPFSADSTVRSVLVRRFGRGLGTVDVYITSGTASVDDAVTQGQSVVRVPSAQTLSTVQTYLNNNAPLTDCPMVYGPTETAINVTVNVTLATGVTLTTVPSNSTYNPLGLNVEQLIQREVGRSLYRLPVGGRIPPGQTSGFVIASEIESNLDYWLSATPDYTTGLPKGLIPVLFDREIQPLNGTSYNLPVGANILTAPGTISVVVGV